MGRSSLCLGISCVLSGSCSKQNDLGFYLHSAHPAPWRAPGWHFHPDPAACSCFCCCLGSQMCSAAASSPGCGSSGRDRRWQKPQGFSGAVPPSLDSGEIPSGALAAPGMLQEWLGRDPSLGALSWHGQLPKFRGFTDLGVGPLTPNVIPSSQSLEKPQIPALLSHLAQGSCPQVIQRDLNAPSSSDSWRVDIPDPGSGELNNKLHVVDSIPQGFQHQTIQSSSGQGEGRAGTEFSLRMDPAPGEFPVWMSPGGAWRIRLGFAFGSELFFFWLSFFPGKDGFIRRRAGYLKAQRSWNHGMV